MTEEFSRFQELLKSGNLTAALKVVEQQLLEKTDPFWLTQQARVLVKQRKYKPALQVAQKSLSIKAADPYTILTLGDALFGLNRYTDALEYYKETISFSKLRALGHRKVLDCLVQLKNWQELLRYNTRVEIDAVDFYPYQVKALGNLERTAEAIQVCNTWLNLQPHQPRALRELMELQIKQDGLEAVLQHMERMAQIPSLPAIYKELYAALCARAGDHAKARNQLAELKKSSTDPWVERRNAFAMAKNGQERDAIPLLEEFLRSEPEDKYLHASYAAACRRVGELSRALEFYEQLLSANPEAKSLYGRIKGIKTQLRQTHAE